MANQGQKESNFRWPARKQPGNQGKKLPTYHISGSPVKQTLKEKMKEKGLLELKRQERLKRKAETLAIKKAKCSKTKKSKENIFKIKFFYLNVLLLSVRHLTHPLSSSYPMGGVR